jgi:hypothetical protein
VKPQTYYQRPETIEAFYCERAGEHDLNGVRVRTTQDNVYVTLDVNGLAVEVQAKRFHHRWVDGPTYKRLLSYLFLKAPPIGVLCMTVLLSG